MSLPEMWSLGLVLVWLGVAAAGGVVVARLRSGVFRLDEDDMPMAPPPMGARARLVLWLGGGTGLAGVVLIVAAMV